MKGWLRWVVAAVGIGGIAGPADAFQVSGDSWPGPEIVMELQLGSSGGPLTDGSVSWGQAVEGALASWNLVLATTQFRVVRDSTAPISFRNSFNNVYFDTKVDGGSFGGAVAITIFRTRGTEITEGDVVFNSSLPYDSYRGPLKRGADGSTIYDIRRVALHEFGHVLGLDHPDQFGQNVVAVMNSRVSNTDDLQSDDIAGGQAIYGARPGGGGGVEPRSGVVGQVSKPAKRKVATNNRRFTLRGFANRAEGARRVVLENNRFRGETYRARGVTNWRAKVDLKRGRNRVKVFVEDREGTRTRVRSVIILRQGR